MKANEKHEKIHNPDHTHIIIAAKQKIKERDYWLSKLGGEIEKNCFYPDSRESKNERNIEKVTYPFPGECSAKLIKISSGSDLKLHVLLAAGITLLLHKYTGNNDIVIGTSMYKQDIEADFINTTLVLRNDVKGNMTFRELLLEMKQTILEAVENRNYPVEILADQLTRQYSPEHDFPLFDVSVLLLNIQGKKFLRPIKHNMLFSFSRNKKCIEGEVEYNSLLYQKKTIKRIINHLILLLQRVLVNLELELSRIEILSQEEKRRILFEFNDTTALYPQDKTLHQLFAEQVEQTPDNIAAVGPLQTKNRTYMTYMTYFTYRELNQKSNQLARLLIKKGVKPDTIVGIMVKRSLEMIIGILGILKAGGAYLPIDPEYPEERINFMLKDSKAKILLAAPDLTSAIEPSLSTLISTSTCQVRPTNLAYLIYTSGSTGKPKGVMIEHRGVFNTIYWRKQEYSLSSKDMVLQLFSFVFDGFVTSFFTPIVSGSQVVLPPEGEARDPVALQNIILSHHISHFISVPSLYLMLLEDAPLNLLSSLKVITLAGEAITSHLLETHQGFHSCPEVVNEYGATENSIAATFCRNTSKARPGSIGKPISNTKVYIIDKYGHLLPPGVPGELCVSGRGVARGYMNQPELTAEKFCLRRPGGRFLKKLPPWTPHKNFSLKGLKGTDKNHLPMQSCIQASRQYHSLPSHYPITPFPHSPTYLTGDLARWQPDGNIEFLGRMDFQVKIRGFRIELEEIENQLLKHDRIKDAVVLTKEEKNKDKTLCAYIVARSGPQGAATGRIDINELREYLSARLPDYLVPSYFVSLKKIPLTPSGKLDRKALPTPKITVGSEYISPRSELEKKLLEIWQEVLGFTKDNLQPSANQLPLNREQYPKIGINDNFFELGGHSLKAMLLVSRVYKEFNVKLPLNKVFAAPTIKSFAQLIKDADKSTYKDIIPGENREYYALSSAQKRLFFLNRFEHIGTSYNLPFVIKTKGEVVKERLENAFCRMIARHESLRTSFISIDNEPVQRIHDKLEFKIGYYDMKEVKAKVKVEENQSAVLEGTRGLAPLSKESAASMIKAFIRPFDLSQAPLLRVGLLKMAEHQHLFLFDMHHIISDGTSMDVLTSEFIRLYNNEELPVLKIQYKDFSNWQNHLFASDKITEQEKYWMNLYSDAREIPRLNLPTDYVRPEIMSFEGDSFDFQLPGAETTRFKELSARGAATLYMNLLAVLNLLLHKYTGQEDIVVGSGIAGRPHPDLQKIIGMFVNTLAMRNYPRGEITYLEFLQEVKENSIKAFENQDMQFETLVDKLNIERDPSRNALFDLFFIVQNFEETPIDTRGLTYEPFPYENKISQFDLALDVHEIGDSILFHAEYCTKLFKKDTIARFIKNFTHLMMKVCQVPDSRISEIDILSQEEKQLLLYDFNKTTAPYPQDTTINQLFDRQAQKIPDHTAVVYEDQYLTYGHLKEKANQLANYLYFERNILPDDPVGILMNSSIDCIIAIFGILTSGSAYVPLDPVLPEERIKQIINDLQLKNIISRQKYIKILNRLQWECKSFQYFLCLDSWSIYSVPGIEKSDLINQEKIWNYIGETANDEISGGGWRSSYTGELFSKTEMEEYGNNILVKLLPLLHKKMRTLEIGCASGISMFRLAPKVGYYYGTDLSTSIIKKNNRRVKQEGYQNISLSCVFAHEIDKIGEKDFDLVIMNSVIQDFYSHNYLRIVISKIMDLMKEKGYLFIGDIMDQDLKNNLIHEMIDFKQKNRDKNHKTKTDFSSELFISRAFFEDLIVEFPGIQKVEFSNKIYTIENELTKFRYDALLTIDNSKKKKKNTRTRAKHKYQHDQRVLNAYNTSRSYVTVTPGNLAYIIFTSGTTGKSNGVMIDHGNLLATINWFGHTYDIKPGCHVLQMTNISFDVSAEEIFATLAYGGTIYIPTRETTLDQSQLIPWLKAKHINIAQFVPAALKAFLAGPGKIESLDTVICGGDQLNEQLKNIIRSKGYNLYNHYGPTEITVDAVSCQCDQSKVLIGKPIANVQVFIEENNRLTPIGIPGELCISGPGLSRGYLNRPTLTAEKFVRNPFVPPQQMHMPMYMYRSGDLARWTADGNIEFLGRMDQQVKIRGFRIELEEIENQLLNHESIKDALVLDRIDSTGGKYLCAYIVSNEKIDLSGVKYLLAKHLPGYMIPSFILQIEKVPLTHNAKVDRRALPDPGIMKDKNYSAPGDDIERTLAAIWSEVLGIRKEMIGIDANFFDLGGHSLKATVFISKVHKELKVKLPLVEVFNHQTIRELAQYIRNSHQHKYASIKNVEKKEYYDLSAAQKRLYILQQLEQGNTHYNMPYMIPIERKINKNLLENTFKKLVQRHESFRTDFHLIDEKPVQKIHEKVEFNIEYDDITKSFIRPFDLSQAPLLRVGLLHTPTCGHHSQQGKMEDKYILIVDMHHIISDGISQDILEREFTALYEKQELTTLRLQYKDYSQWQNSEEQQEIMKTQEKYWLKEFSHHHQLPVLNLPTDYPRPLVQSFEGKQLCFFINKELSAALKELSQKTNTTLFMILLSVYNILLSKLSGQEDVIVGTPTAGRRHADLQGIVGMFVNTLSMRNYPESRKNFLSFLKEVKERTLEVFENQEYQFENLVERVSIGRDAGRNPVFDVVFNFLNQAEYPWEIKEIHVDTIKDGGECKANFDIIFEGTEIGDAIYFTVIYCTKLYAAETPERFINCFKKILSQVVESPQKKIAEIEIISPEEKKRILYDFNDTTTNYPKDKTIHQLFEQQVEQIPDHIAVIGPLQIKNRTYMTYTTYITYRELNEKSNQLAHLLIEKGIQPDNIVGIMIERSIQMIVGILGILKAGGAYLPIDTEYPLSRIRHMLTDSCTKILVTTPGLSEKFEKLSNVYCLLLTINEKPPYRRRLNNPPKEANSINNYQLTINNLQLEQTNLAYAIYTSGTTGKPKGTLTTHANVIRVVKNTNYIDISKEDRFLQLSNYAFDGSVFDICGALLNGAALAMIKKQDVLSSAQLSQYITRQAITVFFVTTALFNILIDLDIQCLSQIRKVLFGGEKISVEHSIKALKYLGKDKIIHVYGPTETTVYATYYHINNIDEKKETIPIGQPLSNTVLYVMGKSGEFMPIGVPGELSIGGAGVARGYLNDPQLTSEKFCLRRPGGLFSRKPPPWTPRKSFSLEATDKDHMQSYNHASMHPCNHESMQLATHHSPQYPNTPFPHSPIYLTGDLTRWLPDGNIEFLGRIDHQVKIRGFRVELGEIENQLLYYPGIKEAVVLARKDHTGNKYLCAYIVSYKKPVVPKLREYLVKNLPSYMIPSYFVPLTNIPLNPNGKIDRKALPEPETGSGAGKYTPPRDQVEKKLAAIWCEVLGKDTFPTPRHQSQLPIGIDDNFFEIGGHSLRATLMTAKIHKELQVKLPLAEIFKTPRIRELAGYIKNLAKDRYTPLEPVEKKDYYALSSAQKRLYILQQMEANNINYNMPIVLNPEKTPEKEKLEKIFKKLINRHESFRTSFHMKENQPVQRIREEVEFEVEYYDMKEFKDVEEQSSLLEGTRGLAPLPEEPATRSPQPAAALISSFIRPFDLTQAPLLRVGFIELLHTPTALRGHPSQERKEGKYVLIIDMHHIISDGTSQDILEREFAALYKREELAPLRLQYKDYSQWQNSKKQQEIMKTQEKYWLKEFPHELPVLNLPTDYPRPLVQSFEGKQLCFYINKKITSAIKELSQKTNTTLYMVLLSVFNILLSKLSGQEDIIVGTPTAGRTHADLQNIVGMFVNTLSIRNYPEESKPFLSFLKEVKQRTLETYENQEYQFEDLVDKVSVGRDTSRNPVFDVMFNFLNITNFQGTANIQEVDFDTIENNEELKANFDISFQGSEAGDTIYFTVDYCTKLYKDETIKRFINYFKRILLEITSEPGKHLSSIELISSEERKQILLDFNDTTTNYPSNKTIHRLFEEQAGKTPDHVALVGKEEAWKGRRVEGKKENISITYNELNEKSNQLACQLREKGVHPDTIVGIMMERSIEMVIGILAILKANSAYLPIDPGYPEERIKYMLADSKVNFLLKKDNNFSFLSQEKEQEESFKEIEIVNCHREKTPPFHLHLSSAPAVCLAYVIYTSGSAGKPKGVMVEHTSVVNVLSALQLEYPFIESDTYLFKTSYVFDVSVTELCGWFFGGGRLAILENGAEKDPQQIIAAIKNYRVTHINFVPSMFTMFTASLNQENINHLSRLKYIFLAGETLSSTAVEGFRQLDNKIKLENIYGPTEATIYSCKYSLSAWDGSVNIPIGKPLQNTKLYILDKNNHLQPCGVPGELCITGTGTARGYLNNPQLTAEKFIRAVNGHSSLVISSSKRVSKSTNDQWLMTNDRSPRYPITPFPQSPIYLTGDLACWLPDGNIEFLGRIDHQVKIRGFRVELAEIEYQLLKIESIKQVIVIDRKKKSGQKYLCAYFTAEKPLNPGETRNFLRRHLPDYMIPSHLIQVDTIPLTPTGKVNRHALPPPGTHLKTNYIAPKTDIEMIIAQTWKEVLELDKVGINNNIFELGGTSLDLVRLSSRLKTLLKKDIPVLDLFRYPTINSLAAYLDREETEPGIPGDERADILARGKKDRMRRLQKQRGNR